MPLPDFTPDECYLVNFVKSPSAAGAANCYVWGYLLGTSVFAGFAVYQDSIAMLLSAFAIVCGFRVYEERYQAKWTPVWRSIIEKYEAAALGDEDLSGSDG